MSCWEVKLYCSFSYNPHHFGLEHLPKNGGDMFCVAFRLFSFLGCFKINVLFPFLAWFVFKNYLSNLTF